MTSLAKTLLLALTMIAAAALDAAPASACRFLEPPAPIPNDNPMHYGIAIGGVATLDLGFVIAQAAAGREMFGPEAAGLEIGVGAAQLVAIPFVIWGASESSSSACGLGHSAMGEAWSLAGTMFGAGGWLIAHGLWSLFDTDDVTPIQDFVPSVSISPEGASLTILGRF